MPKWYGFCESCGQEKKCPPKPIPVMVESKKQKVAPKPAVKNVLPSKEMWTTLRAFAAEWQQEENAKEERRRAARERRSANPKCQANDQRMKQLGNAWKALTPEQKKQYGNKFYNFVKVQKK